MASRGALVVRFIGDTRDFERATKRTTGVLGKVGNLAAGAFAGTAAVAFLKDTVKSASELEQSIGGVRAVFGKYADGVERDSKRAAKALGLSRNAYNELITVSGAMLKNKGIADFAGQSRNLVKTGADLAAQFGGQTKDAVDALNAAMRGESDPIERYGISLNETAVKAVLAARGQGKLTGAALEQAKAMARLHLIQKQSADAHGAFARESDTLAGKQARLSATWKNMTTRLGTALLPAISDGVGQLSEFVDGMEDGSGAGGKFADVLRDVGDVLKDVATVGKGVLSFFNGLPGPVKKFGVEGLIAFAVYRKLTGLMGTFSASLAGPIAKTKQLRAEMTYAETRTQRVTAATQAFGGVLRNVAGTGGMLAMVDGAKRSNKAIGALEITAGAAAAGFAVGGPWGAAIGGAAGGLISLYKAVNKSKDAVKISLPSWKEYAATLDGVAASATHATREMVLNRLESSGALKVMNQLGLTERQAVNAVLGHAGARQKLAQALRHSRGLTDEQKAALIREAGAVAASRKAQLEHNIALAENREELRKAKKALAEFMASPAAKKVSLDTSQAQAAARALSRGLREALGLTRDLNTAGRGGVGNLLKAPVSGPKKPKKGSRSSDPAARTMEDAGRTTGESYARGVETARMTVKKALGKFSDLASKAAEKLASLKDIRAGFLSTFQADSVFGADMSSGGGIGALMDFQQKQAQQAAQLVADIQRAASMGLSKSLISQLQSQGTSGAAALHAIASGTADQIRQLNALNAQTSSSLSSAGMLAGNIVRGGNINADISSAAAEDARLERLVRKLRKMQGDDVVVIQIDSETIIRAIKKRNRRRGVRTADL